MKSFGKYKSNLDERDCLLSKLFEWDDEESKIELSKQFKDRIHTIFNDAVKAKVKTVIEAEYEIVDNDVPEPVQNEDYISQLASII